MLRSMLVALLGVGVAGVDQASGEQFISLTNFLEESCGGHDGCCCGPACEISGGYLFMAREYYHDTPIITSQSTSATVVGTGTFEGDFQSGFELSARTHQLEVRYFQLSNGLSARANASFANQIVYQGDAYFSTLVVDYDTDLYNGEINRYFTDACSPVQFSAGFRYLRLNENITGSFPGFLGEIYTQTRNDLYGAQIGIDTELVSDCEAIFSLRYFANAGLFYSDTRLASFPNASGAVTLGSTSDSSDRLGFVGEIGIKAQVQVTRRVTMDAGYQVLFINGVAIAGEQPQGIDMQPLQPATSAIRTGDLLYHGLTTSATFRW